MDGQLLLKIAIRQKCAAYVHSFAALPFYIESWDRFARNFFAKIVNVSLYMCSFRCSCHDTFVHDRLRFAARHLCDMCHFFDLDLDAHSDDTTHLFLDPLH